MKKLWDSFPSTKVLFLYKPLEIRHNLLKGGGKNDRDKITTTQVKQELKKNISVLNKNITCHTKFPII